MVDDAFRLLDPLYDAALDLPIAERTAFLDREVPTEFRESLDRLLAAAEAHDPLLDRAPVTIGEVREAVGDETDAVGERVGPYRITGLLGEGGMGRVYRANRDDGAFDRAVALKLVRQSLVLAGSDVVERLRRERAVLASLEHPHIARLYGGGETDDGVPWVAMELVDGEPITAYADAHGLDTRARVALAVDVCRAVEHAHRRLVVHRDLKPSNVLVAEGEDGGAEAKLLDFGIARLLDVDAEGLTRTGAPVLTPEYAAPEQLRGGEVTTATDVWALGVLLYELLAGQRPYAPEDAASGSLGRIATFERAVRSPPAPPSQAAPSDRSPALRGDLDAVVLQALRPEAERRYASAGALADDLGRYLDGRPVAARPASRWYLASAFARRNRGAVVAGAAVVVALAVGLAASLLSLGRERDARAAAEAQTARAEAEVERTDAALGFVIGLFAANDAAERSAEATAGELLAAGERRAAALGAGRGAERAVAFSALRDIYNSHHDMKAARRTGNEALRAAREAYGPGHPYALDAARAHMRHLVLDGDYDRAHRLVETTADGYRALGRDGERALGRLLTEWGGIIAVMSTGRPDAERWSRIAERTLREADPLVRAARDSTVLIDLLNGWAHVVAFRDGNTAAVPYHGDAYKVSREASRDPFLTLSLAYAYGSSLRKAGDFDTSAAIFDTLLTYARRTVRSDHVGFVYWLSGAVEARLQRGQPGDAEQALAWSAEADPPDAREGHWTGPEATAVRLSALRAAGRWRALDARAARAIATFEADDPTYTSWGREERLISRTRVEHAFARLALGDAAGVRSLVQSLTDADTGEVQALGHVVRACLAAERGDAPGARAALDAARQSLDGAGLPAHALTPRMVRAGPEGGACDGWVPGR